MTFPWATGTGYDVVKYLWDVPSYDYVTYSVWITPYGLVNGVRQNPVFIWYPQRNMEWKLLLDASLIRVQISRRLYIEASYNFVNGQQVRNIVFEPDFSLEISLK